MPHIVLDYSINIADQVDHGSLLKELNRFVADTGMFSLNDTKARAVEHASYVIGDGDHERSFVTINLQILSGRNSNEKRMLSDGLLKILERYYPLALAEQKASLTVQITEMARELYGKRTSYSD